MKVCASLLVGWDKKNEIASQEKSSRDHLSILIYTKEKLPIKV